MAYDNAAKKGLLFILKKGATTIGGFRSHNFKISADKVEVTTADDTSRWQQLLAGAGIKRVATGGSQVVKDTAAQQAMATDIIAQTNDTYTVTVPGVGDFTGLYSILDLEFAGDQNGEITATVSLESAGDITFTAET